MQAYEGYLENGNIFPVGQILCVPERIRVKIVIDEDNAAKPHTKTSKERFAALEKWRGTVRSDIDEKAELAEAREEKYRL
ncbi:MAG: hypothetical protein FWG70_06915 [Oscillospiraceae bacterium]|nr:hypothetical protein [Oscillospiraceae bacterium]